MCRDKKGNLLLGTGCP
ncbi:hypothetical protein [Paenibacillus tepidiphilus]